MVTMLIFNGVLLFGVVGSSSGNSLMKARWRRDSASPTGSTAWSANNSEGKKLVIPYIGASASDMTPAATTVHTIPTVDPSPSSTYNPYHRNGANGSPVQLSYRQQLTVPNLQAGFQPGQAQASPNRAQSYSTPYSQPGNTQFQTKAPKGNGKSQYFSNPSSYRLYHDPGNPQLRSGQFPVPGGGFPTFPKFKSSSKFPSISSGDYSFENPAKYRFVSGPAFNSQSSSLLGSPQRPGSAYKSNPQSSPKNIGSSPVSLQSSPDVSSYIKALESEPIFLSTGHDYEAHPSSSGLNYDHPKAHSASLTDGPGAFNPNAANYQPLVVPIHSSRSTPQIPQYQAATVNGFPGNRNGQLDAAYQQLANQPQLHFTTGAPTQPVGTFQPIVYHSNPLEKIRTDVELIDKKTTTTTSPFDSDENDFDQVFKTAGSDFPYLATDGGSSPSLKSLSRDSFELPASNLFNSYDQAFGKYSRLASLERENAPKFTPSPLDDASKPVYQSVKEDDEAEDDEDKSSGEYRSNYEEKDSNASYEEDEEESRRSEKKGSHDDKRPDNDEDGESASYSSYGHDFEKEFEDSYREDLPKSDYVHVKQVPEVEESNGKSRRQRPATRISRLAANTRHNEKPKKIADSQGYASRSSYRSTTTNEPRIEESFGYKIPRDRGTKRFAGNDDDDTTVKGEKSSEVPSTSTLTPITDLQSYTFPAFNDWKPTTKLPTDRGSYGTSRQDVRAFFNAESSPNIFPQVHRGSLTFSSNGQAPRDLTGI